jgi:hypothetical protein
MNGNIEVTNTGYFVDVSKGNNATSAQGQGVITTKDGGEKANYTFLAVGKVTEEGKPVFLGSAVWRIVDHDVDHDSTQLLIVFVI